MGKQTEISWTTHSFNPWIGCAKVPGHPGCAFCYAEELMDARYHRVKWGKGQARSRTSEANWKEPLAWNREAKKAGVRAKVFCASLADIFDEEVDDQWRYDLFGLIANTENLDWQILTKRPAKALEFFSDLTHAACCEGAAQSLYQKLTGEDPSEWFAVHFPMPNVWIGVSVSDQKTADKYIPELLKIPARVRCVSYEPALGPVDFTIWTKPFGNNCCPRCGWEAVEGMKRYVEIQGETAECLRCKVNLPAPCLDWIIVGGESGAKARPFNIEWARSTVAQCAAAGTACFVKQLGAVPIFEYAPGEMQSPGKLRDKKGGEMSEWPEDLRVRQFPNIPNS